MTKLKEHVKGAVKTGTGAFVIFELLNGLANIVQGLLQMVSDAVWRLLGQNNSRQSVKEEMDALIAAHTDEDDAEFERDLSRLPAGKQLAIRRKLKLMEELYWKPKHDQ